MLGRSKPRAPAPSQQGMADLPTQRVLSLSSQGLSEPEIVRTLNQEGYSPSQVNMAMKDAMRSGATGPRGPEPPRPPHMAPPAPAPTGAPMDQQTGGPPQTYSRNPPMPRPMPPQYQAPPARHAAPPAPAAPRPPPRDSMGTPMEMQPRPFAQDRFAPTQWDDDDMMDDDFDIDNLPRERKMGPGALISDLEGDIPGGQPQPVEREPLPFARAPLPKDKDDRTRELKERKRRDVEELIEQITEEKWQDMSKRVQDLEERAEKMSADIRNGTAQAAGPAPEEMGKIKDDLSSLKHGMEDTNARIDSLEEVMKGSLTPMLNSIKKLKSAAAGSAAHPAPEASLPKASASPEEEETPRYAPPKEKEGE